MDISRYLTPSAAAKVIGCTVRNIGLLRKDGLLPGCQQVSKRSFLIPKSAVEKYARKPRKRGRPKTISA